MKICHKPPEQKVHPMGLFSHENRSALKTNLPWECGFSLPASGMNNNDLFSYRSVEKSKRVGLDSTGRSKPLRRDSMRLFRKMTAKSRQKDKRREDYDDRGIKLTDLDESVLEEILKHLDLTSFLVVSKTCKRLNEVSNCHRSWSSTVMQKKIESTIYRAGEREDFETIRGIYESCLKAELLQSNYEILCEAMLVYVWKNMGGLAGKLLSLITKVEVDESEEIWPFCQLINKEIEIGLSRGRSIKVKYCSLSDQQTSFNCNSKILVTIKNHETNDKTIAFNDKPSGLLDCGIRSTKAKHDNTDPWLQFQESTNPEVLRPSLELIEKELGVKTDSLTPQYFMQFLQIVGDIDDSEEDTPRTLWQESKTFRMILERVKTNRNRLELAFLRTEIERFQQQNQTCECDGIVYSLGKLAKIGNNEVRNLRLKAECIKNVLQDPKFTVIRNGKQNFCKTISKIDFDSLQHGWACTSPILFTIWKEFNMNVGKGKLVTALVTWEEKRERLNEYSVSSKELCLTLQHKKFTSRLKMGDFVETEERNRAFSIQHIKQEVKKIFAKLHPRKTGLEGVSKHLLFCILVTIMND